MNDYERLAPGPCRIPFPVRLFWLATAPRHSVLPFVWFGHGRLGFLLRVYVRKLGVGCRVEGRLDGDGENGTRAGGCEGGGLEETNDAVLPSGHPRAWQAGAVYAGSLALSSRPAMFRGNHVIPRAFACLVPRFQGRVVLLTACPDGQWPLGPDLASLATLA